MFNHTTMRISYGHYLMGAFASALQLHVAEKERRRKMETENKIAERAKELLSDVPNIKIGLAEILTDNVIKIYYISYDKVELSRIKYLLEQEFCPFNVWFTCVPTSAADKEKIFRTNTI